MPKRSGARAPRNPLPLCLRCQAECDHSMIFCLPCEKAISSLSAKKASDIDSLWSSSMRSNSLAKRKQACTALAHLLCDGYGKLHTKHEDLRKKYKAL